MLTKGTVARLTTSWRPAKSRYISGEANLSVMLHSVSYASYSAFEVQQSRSETTQLLQLTQHPILGQRHESCWYCAQHPLQLPQQLLAQRKSTFSRGTGQATPQQSRQQGCSRVPTCTVMKGCLRGRLRSTSASLGPWMACVGRSRTAQHLKPTHAHSVRLSEAQRQETMRQSTASAL